MFNAIKAPWVRTAITRVRDETAAGDLQAQYDAVLSRLRAIYSAASASERAHIEKIDRDFHAGRPDALVAWARRAIPGAFATAAPAGLQRRRASMPAVTPVEDLRHLPARLYHGSRAYHRVLTEGFWLPPAANIHNDAYAWKARAFGRWPINWAPLAWRWFRGLTPAGRRSLEAQSGGPIRSQFDLGNAISLLWTSDDPRLAAFYRELGVESPVLEIDPRRLALYGYFEADEAGRGEMVLVLSAQAPQGRPNAVVGVVEAP